jgi:hypothetical protein
MMQIWPLNVGGHYAAPENDTAPPETPDTRTIRSAYFYNPVLCLLLINKGVDKVGRNIARQHRRAAQ